MALDSGILGAAAVPGFLGHVEGFHDEGQAKKNRAKGKA